MDKDLASLITQVATGGGTDFDAAVFPDTYHASLWLRKLHVPFDYRVLGVDPKVIDFDSGTVSFAHQFTLPAYNKQLLPPRDVPRNWRDLLDPKWKGGKLGVTNATPAHLAVLAMAWGEEETTKYIKALAQQNLVIGRLGETYSRLLLGELAIAVTLTNSFIFTAERSGAPIVFADIEPVVSPPYHVGVLKGARHPMAGHLFSAFSDDSRSAEDLGRIRRPHFRLYLRHPREPIRQGQKGALHDPEPVGADRPVDAEIREDPGNEMNKGRSSGGGGKGVGSLFTFASDGRGDEGSPQARVASRR